MKTTAVLALLLVPFVADASFSASHDAPAQHSFAARLKDKRPIVVAHRGCHESAPENSLGGFRACIDRGVAMAECDVHATRDGVLVLMHDATLDRMTDLTGRVNDYTYAELQKARLRLGNGGQQAPLTDEPVPRLADALDVSKNHLFLLLHVKEQEVDPIYQLVEANGAQARVAFLVSAPAHDPVLRKARFLGKAAYVPGILQCSMMKRTVDCYNDDELDRAFRDYAPLHPTVWLPASDGNAFLIKSASAVRHTDLRIMGTLDDEDNLAAGPDATWGPLLKLGVSLILTEHPAELAGYLNGKRASLKH